MKKEIKPTWQISRRSASYIKEALRLLNAFLKHAERLSSHPINFYKRLLSRPTLSGNVENTSGNSKSLIIKAASTLGENCRTPISASAKLLLDSKAPPRS